MSELHAASAPDRADTAEREWAYYESRAARSEAAIETATKALGELLLDIGRSQGGDIAGRIREIRADLTGTRTG